LTNAERFIARCEELWPGSMVIWPNKKESNPMAYTPKPGSGTLFKNDRKEAETDRDYNGSIVLPDGTEHWLSGWLKTSQKTGQRFLSVAIGKPKAEKIDRSRPLKDELSDEIPW
jgi:hypothetical protein